MLLTVLPISTTSVLESALKKLRLASTLPAACALSFALASVFAPAKSTAQEFPKGQTITIVVGFVPGGGTDTATRIVAKSLAANLGQPVVVENRP
jgi:tripartite-type tricarboxylate transporter receptor subunit TctC